MFFWYYVKADYSNIPMLYMSVHISVRQHSSIIMNHYLGRTCNATNFKCS